MSKVHVLVLRAAGINCDEEVVHGWRLAGGTPTLMHLGAVANRPSILDDFQIVTIPGGFSYGDDIAAGTILAQRVMQDLSGPLQRLVDRGGGIFGICNGFQVLVKAGLLPGGNAGRDQLTVTYNDSAKFEARWVRLQVCTDQCPFLTSGVEATKPSAAADKLRHEATEGNAETSKRHNVETTIGNRQSAILELPVEHAEGKVVTSGDAVTEELERKGQIALRYVDEKGHYDTYPANPNGSTGGIAGLCDPTGRVFGLMPHPDRHLDHTQHPLWTRRKRAAGDAPDGLSIFQNAVAHWSRSA